MKLTRLIISFALAVLSVASMAQSQDLMGFDRRSYSHDTVVLSKPQSAGSRVQLEAAVGTYNNEPIRNYGDDTIFAKIGRSVGRLDVLTDKGLFPCTAFIVSKKYILTNYHCSLGLLDNEQIGATRIDVSYFVAGYTMTGIDAGTKKYTVIPTPVEFDEDLDYAVLEVLGDPSQEYGELKLASLVPQGGTPFWIIGHPHGEGQRISREKCKASDPAISKNTLLHTCDTLPGNSGSPVIDAGLQQVVALHHMGSKKDSVNYAIPMSEILKNSAVLAAYKAPEEASKSQPVEPKTAAVSACDALFSEAKEAKACYAYDVYINSCPAHTLAPMARGYVNEFCQPQETVELEKTCDDDPNLCNTDQLCGQSLTFKSGKAAWRNDHVSYVTESKRRGLNCGVVEVVAEPKKSCSEDVTYCNKDQVCTVASNGVEGQRFWTKNAVFLKYVAEAKRRGLTCGVAEVVAIPATKPEGIFAKAHFAKLGRTERKQLQYGLKQLGYYSSSIDGLWGKGTKAGVNVFAKDRNLSSNFPNSVFDALASEVAFENMPVPEPVAEKAIGNKNKLVCEMVNPEAFDRIEKIAGKRLFHGEFSRTNLRTITLLDDFLIYGEKKVRSLSRGLWRPRRVRRGVGWLDLSWKSFDPLRDRPGGVVLRVELSLARWAFFVGYYGADSVDFQYTCK